QTSGGTSLDARRFESLANSIRTERALVDFLRLLVELGNIERTTRDTVAAADTVLLLKIDDAIFVFDDGAVGRTRAETTGIFAVHALIFAHQPHQIAVALVFDKLDQIPVVPLGRRHCLIGVIES